MIIKSPDYKEKEFQQKVNLIADIPLVVTVVLAQKFTSLSSVLKLQTGSIIQFEKHISEPFDVVIDNKRIAKGFAVKVGEKFGIRISEMEKA